MFGSGFVGFECDVPLLLLSLLLSLLSHCGRYIIPTLRFGDLEYIFFCIYSCVYAHMYCKTTRSTPMKTCMISMGILSTG